MTDRETRSCWTEKTIVAHFSTKEKAIAAMETYLKEKGTLKNTIFFNGEDCNIPLFYITEIEVR